MDFVASLYNHFFVLSLSEKGIIASWSRHRSTIDSSPLRTPPQTHW